MKETRFPGIWATEDGELIGRSGNPMKGWVDAKGYRRTTALVDGRVRLVWFHKVICEAFHGPRPTPDHQAAHGDGNPGNNRPSNLRWATAKENEADKERHGTKLEGEKVYGSKLTEEKVRTIRRSYSEGACSQYDLSGRYGVSQRTIGKIVRRETWKHI